MFAFVGIPIFSTHPVEHGLPASVHDELKKTGLHPRMPVLKEGNFRACFPHSYGWAHLQMPLIEIKEEARRLKELRKIRR